MNKLLLFLLIFLQSDFLISFQTNDNELINSNNEIEIQGESFICKGDSTVLSVYPIKAFDRFQWSGGQTTPNITAKSEGIYEVIRINQQGEIDSASFYLAVRNKPDFKIVGDSLICIGDSLLIYLEHINKRGIVNWSDGSISDTLIVKASGEIGRAHV